MILQTQQLGEVTNLLQSPRMADEELTRLFPKRAIQKVLFVVPPDVDATLFNYDSAKRGRCWNYPAYGTGVIATHLREMGIAVKIVNLNNEVLKACIHSSSKSEFEFDGSWEGVLRCEVEAFEPDLAGISVMFSQTHSSAVRVLNYLKRSIPDLPVAMGGVHVTNCIANEKTSGMLNDDCRLADLFFTHEAELAFTRFVQAVNGKTPAEELVQVRFNGAGARFNFPRQVIPRPEQLDVIPAYDLLSLDELSHHGKVGSFYCLKEDGTRFATVLSNRGCRAACTFCSVRNFNGRGVRSRSIQSVIDELKILRDDYGIGHVMWLDDDFLHDSKRALELFNQMVRQKVEVTWDCTNGVIAASCTDELIAAAAESGCIGLNIGMESGNPKILRDIKKPGNVHKFLAAAMVLRRYEQINARVFLMIGFPGESYRMILDTIDVAKEMNLDWYNVTILQPLPNTPIFESMAQQGLLNELDFKSIRYNSGAYGKHRKLADDNNKDVLSNDFADAFKQADMDAVPPAEQLDDIWAYMNYHLNFKRLFRENRPTKLLQQFKYVRNISDLVAPENAFAMYFQGYLQHKIFGGVDSLIIDRLEIRLSSSIYWRKRFEDFQLSVDHLKVANFPAALA